MGSLNFKKYMHKFEREVICKGVSLGEMGRLEQVACRPGKMSESRFAKEIGSSFDYEEPLAIVYYGHYKKSSAFSNKVKTEKDSLHNRQLKMISAKVVHFASIKIEQISKLTNNEYLLGRFAEFKKEVLVRRGFFKA